MENKRNKKMKKEENILYAIHYQGKLIKDVKSLWKQYTEKYGDIKDSIQGWKAPKKVYFSLGRAKAGLTHLPKQIIKDCEIIAYFPFDKG